MPAYKMEKMENNKNFKVTIDSLAFGGEGVGRVDGKVCFVRGALPGEEVIFSPTKETNSYFKGGLVDIVKASDERVPPACKYYGLCGGCDLQHIGYASELKYKREQLRDLFIRFAGVRDIDIPEIIASSKEYFYRSHITLHKTGSGCGFFKRDGKGILDIDMCNIADEAINTMIASGGIAFRKDRVTLKADSNGKVWTSGAIGERFFADRFGISEMTLSPLAFTQCNRDIAQKMTSKISEWIGMRDGHTTFFDVYCGCGFFSFLVDIGCGKIGIDSDRISIDCAKATKRNNGYDDVRFYRGDAEKYFVRLFEKNRNDDNILLVDPPRKGVSKYFIEWIKTSRGIGSVYFISCDPARMARDTGIMLDGGPWKLGRTLGLDMFPKTKHIEVMVEFVRK